MTKTLFPKSNNAFLAAARVFSGAVTADPVGFDTTNADAANLAADTTAFQTSVQDVARLRNELGAALITRNENRATLESGMRRRTRQYKAGGVSDSLLERAGVSPDDLIPTRLRAPDSAPRLSVEIRGGLQHRLLFWEEGAKRRIRKPKGVWGVEVWMEVGGDGRNMTMREPASRSPHILEYKPEEAGKTAYIMLRWVNRLGEKSPFSAVMRATIAA